MNKKLVKKLAEKSFTNNTLDSSKIDKFTKNLRRADLKVYIKDIKNIKSQHIVTVTVPNENGLKSVKDYIIKVYPNKKIIINLDPTLLNGIKVVEFDNEYEFSLLSIMEGSVKNTND